MAKTGSMTLTLTEPVGAGTGTPRMIEVNQMDDGTVAVSIFESDVADTPLAVAIVSAQDLARFARALPVLGIVPAE